MNKRKRRAVAALLLGGLVVWMPACGGNKTSQGEKAAEQTEATVATMKARIVATAPTTLFDKELSEIKDYTYGKWELVSGKNTRELCEFENTFITIDDDHYVWTEDGESEAGEMNWRKAATGIGYDAYLMDVFYAEYPSFPLSIHRDTLYIQDCTATGYTYKLVRR